MIRYFLFLLPVLLVSCSTDEGVSGCLNSMDCPDGSVCEGNTCVPATDDTAGVDDDDRNNVGHDDAVMDDLPDADISDTANTGDSGDSGDTADTGNSANTGNTGDTSDSGNSADTANTGDSGNTADSADTGDPCSEVNCGDHGSCESSGGEAECVCDTGYAGDTCGECAEQYEQNGDGCEPLYAITGITADISRVTISCDANVVCSGVGAGAADAGNVTVAAGDGSPVSGTVTCNGSDIVFSIDGYFSDDTYTVAVSSAVELQNGDVIGPEDYETTFTVNVHFSDDFEGASPAWDIDFQPTGTDSSAERIWEIGAPDFTVTDKGHVTAGHDGSTGVIATKLTETYPSFCNFPTDWKDYCDDPDGDNCSYDFTELYAGGDKGAKILTPIEINAGNDVFLAFRVYVFTEYFSDTYPWFDAMKVKVFDESDTAVATVDQWVEKDDALYNRFWLKKTGHDPSPYYGITGQSVDNTYSLFKANLTENVPSVPVTVSPGFVFYSDEANFAGVYIDDVIVYEITY